MSLPIIAIVEVLGALGGLALTRWALFCDRSRGLPRCLKCWYLMVGHAGMRCPECGHVITATDELYCTWRRWCWAVSGLLIALGSPASVMATRYSDELLLAILPRWAAVGDQHLGLFTIGLYADRRDNRPMQARITRDGEPQFTVSAWDVSIGARAMGGTQTVGVTHRRRGVAARWQ